MVRSNTGHAYQGLGLAYAALGLPDESRRAYDQARAIYRELDHHALIAISLLTDLRDTVIPYQATDPQLRWTLAAEAEAALRRAGGALLPGVSPRLGWLSCFVLDGRWDEALQLVEELPPPGNVYFRREITATIASLSRYRGLSAAGWEQIRVLLPEGPRTPPGVIVHQEALMLQRLAADLCRDVGDTTSARVWLEAHDRWLGWNDAVLGRADGELAWACLAQTSGDLEEARSRATAALCLAAAPRQPLVLLAAHRFLGELAVASGQAAAAERDLAAALALAEACAAPRERMVTLLALAEQQLATTARTAAGAALQEALRIAQHLGTMLPRARVEPLARALPAWPAAPTDPPPRAGGWLQGLTRRERDVALLLARGCSNREIAEDLTIGERTVETHVSSILAKLDLTSRAQVAALAGQTAASGREG